MRKPSKTLAGVTPVAVVLPPRKCKHGTCLYCPSLNVPQSYTPKSPAIMRAVLLKYDAYKQVKSRIESFRLMNHPTDKIELIIMGGTFLHYPVKFQYKFVKDCYDALNGRKSLDLQKAQKINETAKHRCVALCIETRPDTCSDEDIKRMREFGATRVELGVQMPDDKIYKIVNRGHSVKDVVDATQRLRNTGFKVGYHIMPGLPSSDLKKDIKLFKKIFSNENFKPEQIKIYPCYAIKGAELESWYWEGKYTPYNKEQLEKLLRQMLKIVPRYCRVMRIMREIPPEYIVGGTTKIDLRKDVEEKLREEKAKIKEIRFREIGFAIRDAKNFSMKNFGATKSNTLPTHRNKQDLVGKEINLDLNLKITKYKASKGDEYFLEMVNKNDILFGLLRLRIFNSPTTTPQPLALKPVINKKIGLFNITNLKEYRANVNEQGKFQEKKAIIRELHVYGQSLNIGEKGIIGQHTGLGKLLMQKAEGIVKKNKIRKLSVISGVGVREYYKKLGYKLEEGYMVKKI
ncbi:MAG: tRNA uridine(34) 5-carboxymethylaminomethyl modification radical SAM/GNAT enzyme Elp3 [Nanoarchaeota archaeon]|nr:tRNA uridine(34) 5-carboxymethylaminomethyl modification radical SAM/GNAT enzyme Elp3 [Nanoarchaeota archaeon]